ncbi:type II secretion system protein [Burkholderia sp. AW49-1]
MTKSHRIQRGSIYIGMMVAVSIVGIMLMEFGALWKTEQQREREADLLAKGGEVRSAIGRYFNAGPVAGTFPASLEDLTRDPRYPGTVRYLRRVYRDPIDGKSEWGTITGSGGGIMGVFSQAGGEPLKQDNFRLDDEAFAGKDSYKDWIFLYHVPGGGGGESPIPLPGPVPDRHEHE